MRGRLVHQAHCPGCDKRLHAPSAAALDKQAARHARNCHALKRAVALLDERDRAEVLATANAAELVPLTALPEQSH